MAKQNAKQIEQEQRQQNVAEAVSKTEVFFKEHGKLIYGIVIAVLVIAIAILAYTRFYLQPKRVEAQRELFHAEQWFAEGDYATALEGDGNYLGFRDVIADYGSKAGAAVYFYAGVSELQLGNFEDAIKYLKKYNGKDTILKARALANIGDAYVGLEDYATALGWFEKAAKAGDNMFAAAYLLKAGIAAEALGQKDKALSFYQEIKDKYFNSPEGMDIDKYITRIQTAE
jgi:tetratricopeptide (TPR) repeat protein